MRKRLCRVGPARSRHRPVGCRGEGETGEGARRAYSRPPRSEGSGSRRAGTRVARTAAIAAADLEDARRARTLHGRRQAVYCDGGPENASRWIDTRRGPLPGGALKSRRMPLFDSQRGVDAPWLFEARLDYTRTCTHKLGLL